MADFIWYELQTTDADAASRFYGEAVGWTVEEGGAGDFDYRHIRRDDGGSVGGMLALKPEMVGHGARAMWVPYLHAADVTAEIAAIEAAGGKLLMPPTTLPVGTFAMVLDPQGVPIYVMAPVAPPGREDQASDVFDEKAVQRVRWNELASPDLAASKAFYSKHFGFGFERSMAMGEHGDYCFIEHDGRTLGAMLQRRDDRQPTSWLLYFGVPSIEGAMRKLQKAGGTLLTGPDQVPGGDWIVVATDPQGARFGLVGPKST